MAGQRSTPRQLATMTAAWFAFGVLDATQTVAVMRSEGMHHSWLLVYAVRIARWLPWVLATTSILLMGRRFPLDPRRPQTSLVHVAGACIVGVVFSAWTVFLDIAVDPYGDGYSFSTFGRSFASDVRGGMLTAVVLYAFVVIADYAVASRERVALRDRDAARLAEQLSEARLEALRRQVEPHFLFNALGAVAGLIREHRNDAAVDMVTSLSDFLRSSLQNSASPLVTLREELRTIERYLDIQKVRFGERLHVRIDVPESLREATVPTLILQPIVENAIEHGIETRLRGGTISIVASASGAMLTLAVSNDGPRLATDWARPGGIGISHVRARLDNLYGERGSVTIGDREPDGVEVRIVLPSLALAAT